MGGELDYCLALLDYKHLNYIQSSFASNTKTASVLLMCHTCITGAGLRCVAAVGQGGALLVAIGGRVLAVELGGESRGGIGGCGTATFDHLAVPEVLLKPRGNDALYCVRHSADQPGLLDWGWGGRRDGTGQTPSWKARPQNEPDSAWKRSLANVSLATTDLHNFVWQVITGLRLFINLRLLKRSHQTIYGIVILMFHLYSRILALQVNMISCKLILAQIRPRKDKKPKFLILQFIKRARPFTRHRQELA